MSLSDPPAWHEVVVQGDVERQITQVLNDLEAATEEYETLGRVAVDDEVAYKVNFAQKLLLSQKKSVGLREAEAMWECEKYLRARRISEEKYRAQGQVLLTLRARLDGLRSLLVSVRTQT